jgi:hypothetical protein
MRVLKKRKADGKTRKKRQGSLTCSGFEDRGGLESGGRVGFTSWERSSVTANQEVLTSALQLQETEFCQSHVKNWVLLRASRRNTVLSTS